MRVTLASESENAVSFKILTRLMEPGNEVGDVYNLATASLFV